MDWRKIGMDINITPEPPYRPFPGMEGESDILNLGFNMPTIFFSWFIIGLLAVVSFAVYRKLRAKPTRLQLLLELIVDAFDNLTQSSLGKRGRKYLAFVGTIFLFVWLSNIIGIIPGFEEPTRDLNTPLGLMILVIIVAHASGIRVKGLRKYIREYFEPGFKIKGRWIPNPFIAPLNIVGEIGKAISLPFRLFGNIFGGAIIIVVLSHLLLFVGLPPFLMFFFGLFVGTIQAFVFAMLAMTYTAVAIAD
ncbi:MAG: ATP synthase F0 subunit A [Planctomycetota bacterium]|nr:MAG: ATP synthase F0 subunit A [Planctomycetota bacterium]